MKTYILYFAILMNLVIFGCKKDEDIKINEMVNTSGKDTLATGNFISSAKPTTGAVKVLMDSSKTFLVFEDFKTDSGPALVVYLSPTADGKGEYIDLGELKARSGNFYYEVPAGTDLMKNNNVLIWCVDFAVLFGYSTLAY